MKTFPAIVSASQKSTEQKSGYQFVCLVSSSRDSGYIGEHTIYVFKVHLI